MWSASSSKSSTNSRDAISRLWRDRDVASLDYTVTPSDVVLGVSERPELRVGAIWRVVIWPSALAGPAQLPVAPVANSCERLCGIWGRRGTTIASCRTAGFIAELESGRCG